MTKKELCEKVFQDLFNGNYEKGKAIVLLQKHLGAKNLEETQKNLQNQFNDREFTDKILQIFSQKTINHEFYLQWIDFMYEYLYKTKKKPGIIFLGFFLRLIFEYAYI